MTDTADEAVERLAQDFDTMAGFHHPGAEEAIWHGNAAATLRALIAERAANYEIIGTSAEAITKLRSELDELRQERDAAVADRDRFHEYWQSSAANYNAMLDADITARAAALEEAAAVLENYVVDLNHGGRLISPPTNHPDVLRGSYAAAIRALATKEPQA